MSGPLENTDIRAQVHTMLIMAHALAQELDRMAGLIADRAGVLPDSMEITDAVYNCTNAGEALMILMGQLPLADGEVLS